MGTERMAFSEKATFIGEDCPGNPGHGHEWGVLPDYSYICKKCGRLGT